jgi:hypothetical protein
MHYSVAILNRILINMHIEDCHNDFYTAILGCKTTSIEYLPEGFTGKAIPAGKYAVFTPVANSRRILAKPGNTSGNRTSKEHILLILMCMIQQVKTLRISYQRFMWR